MNYPQEATENASKIPLEDDPDVLLALLSYIYTEDYDDDMRGPIPLQTYTVQVYAIAQKYLVHGLQHLAASRFEKVCDPADDSSDFINAIQAIEDSTYHGDRELREIVLRQIRENISWLLDIDEFKTLLDSMTDLKWELVSMIGPEYDDFDHGPFWSPSKHRWGGKPVAATQVDKTSAPRGMGSHCPPRWRSESPSPSP
jgi:hypothetical protein